MKIYIQEHAWAGCCIAIADSEEDAREMMDGMYNYKANEPINAYDIVDGFAYSNTGDM